MSETIHRFQVNREFKYQAQSRKQAFRPCQVQKSVIHRGEKVTLEKRIIAGERRGTYFILFKVADDAVGFDLDPLLHPPPSHPPPQNLDYQHFKEPETQFTWKAFH